jgi:hypothetical protein
MVIAGTIAAVAAWQYGRRAARKAWWLRTMLRLLVLPAAFLAAAGAMGLFQALDLSKAASDAAVAIIMVAGLTVIAWPALWSDSRTVQQTFAAPANLLGASRSVHLQAALDAVALMARRPILMLPSLVALASQGLVDNAVAPYLPPIDPGSARPPDFSLSVGLVIIVATLLHALAVSVVSYSVAQLEGAQHISLGAALRSSLVRLPALIGAYVMLLLRVFAGFLLLVVPAVVAGVRGALVSQAVVLGNANSFRAYGVSAELLRNHWWRMLAVLAAETIIAIVLEAALSVVPHVGVYVARTLAASWATITLTLLYVRLGGRLWDASGSLPVGLR